MCVCLQNQRSERSISGAPILMWMQFALLSFPIGEGRVLRPKLPSELLEGDLIWQWKKVCVKCKQHTASSRFGPCGDTCHAFRVCHCRGWRYPQSIPLCRGISILTSVVSRASPVRSVIPVSVALCCQSCLMQEARITSRAEPRPAVHTTPASTPPSMPLAHGRHACHCSAHQHTALLRLSCLFNCICAP